MQSSTPAPRGPSHRTGEVLAALPLCAAFLAWAPLAIADPAPPARALPRWNADPPPQQDEGRTSHPTSVRHGEQRPFVFLQDPSIPLPAEVSVEYTLQGASGVAAMRPLAANLGVQGAVHGATVSIGATPWLAVFASGFVRQPMDQANASVSGTGQAGVRLLFTAPTAPFRLGVSSAVLREFEGSVGVATRVTGTYDIGALRLAGNAHVERVFATGRDSLDLLAFGGASFRATDQLRLGAESVGQDLEDAFERREAEGGARHFAGPVAALQFFGDSLWVTAGPAFGLNEKSPRLLGRLSMVASF